MTNQFAVVLKRFKLHGREFKPGEMITYKEVSYLIENLSNCGYITLPPVAPYEGIEVK